MAKLLHNSVDSALYSLGVGDVGHDRYDALARGLGDLSGCALNILGGQGVEGDVCACLRQHLGNTFTNTASSARDEDDFPGDIVFCRQHSDPPQNRAEFRAL
jgi:hypothetical protein